MTVLGCLLDSDPAIRLQVLRQSRVRKRCGKRWRKWRRTVQKTDMVWVWSWHCRLGFYEDYGFRIAGAGQTSGGGPSFWAM